MNIYTSLNKSIFFKTLIILIATTFTIFGCQKEEEISTPLNIERFKVPALDAAKLYFEANNKIPILDNDNGISLRTDETDMTIKWDQSKTKKYKEPTQSIPQQVDILYTPIGLNTGGGHAKLFLASIDDNGTVDSKYIFLIYTAPENPNLFSGYVFIYDLDGNLENLSKYEEGNKVAIASNSRMAQRDDGGFTMGELLDFIGGDWFGLSGFIENDLVNVYWPEFSEVEDTGGNVGDSSWFNPINIPVIGNTGGGSNGSGTTDPNIDNTVWWQPITIFAHGLSISNAIEVDLNSIEEDWLMNTATQEQLNAIANYLNNVDQTEDEGYNQSDIDYITDLINLLNNNPNLSLTADNSSNTDGYLEFDNFADYEDYLTSALNLSQSYSTTTNAGEERQDRFIYSFNMPLFSHGIEVVIGLIDPDENLCECLEITEASTVLFGNETLVEWLPIGDYWTELSQPNDTLTVFIKGKMTTGIKIDGWPWKQSIIYTFYMVYDYSTGTLISYGSNSLN